jgi:hypothetical protein
VNVYNSGAEGRVKEAVQKKYGGEKQRLDILQKSMEMKGEFGHAYGL